MKLADLLKTVGLMNKATSRNATLDSNVYATAIADVDRIYQAYQPYQQYQNPYVGPAGPVSNPAVGSAYHPQVYNVHGPRDYGMKVGFPHSGSGHAGHTGPANVVGHSGYGPSGHGGPPSHHHPHPAPHHHHGNIVASVGGIGSYDYEHSVSSRHKSKASSAVTALTLLSFFFFINLLQNCLKEHMDAMNPTVMVMTTGVSRNRDNKFKEVYRSDSKGVSLDEESTEEDNNHVHGVLKGQNENRNREQNHGNNFKKDYSHERFTYANGTVTVTNQGDHDQRFQDSYDKDKFVYDSGQIRTKLRNDYFKDGKTHFTRIY